jgi:DNA polymerase I
LSEFEGWLLDVYVQGNQAVLWLKTDTGRVVRLLDRYSPSFYVRPNGWAEECQLTQMLAESPAVSCVSVEPKFVSLTERSRERVIRVDVNGTGEFQRLVRGLKGNQLVAALFDADLRHVQKYLFTRLGVEPTSRVRFGHNGDRLMWMSKVDEPEEVRPPPFSMVRIDPVYFLEDGRRQLTGVVITDKNGAVDVRGDLPEIGSEVARIIRELDPDLVVCPKCDEVTFPLLKEASDSAGVGLGRCGDAEQVKVQGSWGGRIFVGGSMIGHPLESWGIAGMVERARFSFLPMGLASRWLSNKSIDSRNCYELMRRGYAIPEEGYFEYARDLEELLMKDRGGLSITPVSCTLHHNVGALDFDSQYPSIIMSENLSYERPFGGAEGGEYSLIPIVMGPWLRRRLTLKKLKKSLPKGSEERVFCEQRTDALKLIAVTQYGISGCCWNRFGNVLTFEEINRKSRETMIMAKSVAEREGYEIVYGDTDSLFLKKEGASRKDYERLSESISQATGLPMSLDKHFKFLAFPRLSGDPVSSALKRYFGVTYEGEVEARGIELRRDDIPLLVKQFQHRLILTLMDRDSVDDVLGAGVGEGWKVLKETLDYVKSGKADAESLFISKNLRKSPERYQSRVAHVSATRQLIGQGQEVSVGDDVRFLITDHDNPNPLCRVRAAGTELKGYDREVYCKMLVEAARVIFESAGLKLPAEDLHEGGCGLLSSA